MKHHSGERRAVVFLPIIFSASFRQKRADIFELFQNRFNIPHFPLRFSTLKLIFYERICNLLDPFAFCSAELASLTCRTSLH